MDKGFLEASVTGSAVVSRPFELPVLRSLLDEHHFGAIDCVRLVEFHRSLANLTCKLYLRISL